MNRLLKLGLWLVGIIGALGVATAWFVPIAADRKVGRVLTVNVSDVPFRSDVSILDHGKYLFESRGCSQCHGKGGAGKVVIHDENAGLFVKSPSIAPGPGSAVTEYQSIDWVRALRHGIKPNGTALLVMPSEDYARMSDADIAALVAYARSLPSVNGGPASFRLPFMLKAIYVFGIFKDAAEKIDHSRAPSAEIAPAISEKYGEYIAQTCIGCHGPGFSGGKIPGAPPQWPAAANLTPAQGSGILRYSTSEQFIAMFKTGVRPDGTAVSNVMPFESLNRYSDTDMRALFVFFKSLAPRPTGNR